jgi:hypothetical protein
MMFSIGCLLVHMFTYVLNDPYLMLVVSDLLDSTYYL